MSKNKKPDALELWGRLAVSATLGGWCFDYTLWAVCGKDAPWYADALGGVICNGFIMTAAAVCWIIRLCGVGAPFIHP